MRKILTLSAVILLGGCSANCFEKAAITQLTATTTREATAQLTEDKKISKGQAQEAQTAIDIAQSTAKEGAALCFMEDKTDALDKLKVAGKSLSKATKIVEENNGN